MQTWLSLSEHFFDCTFLLQCNEGKSYRTFQLMALAFRGAIYTAEQMFSELFKRYLGYGDITCCWRLGGHKGQLTSRDLNSCVDSKHAVLGLHTNTGWLELAAVSTWNYVKNLFHFRANLQRNKYQYERGEIALPSLAVSDTVGALQISLVSTSSRQGMAAVGNACEVTAGQCTLCN